MEIRSSNPAFRNGILGRSGTRTAEDGVMTMGGTIGKSFVLVALTIASALYTWTQVAARPADVTFLMMIGFIGGFVVAMVTIFRPQAAPITAPIYAVLEGMALGGISMLYNTQYKGLPVQAVMLTFAVFITMLVLYRARVIQATKRFRSVVLAAGLGLMLFYVVHIVMSFFGTGLPLIHSATPMGIGFSLLACTIAAFFLILDFDLVEEGVAKGAPKHMEWYAGFSLLVTLVWLYLEMLRLLGKLRER
ncbi:MAG: Bax inhibitor-1/YccA family protein [Gemmatimonadaceae bacterium]|nr:Bax inhibitor-1/YccA family protein [Gemmatimonadaceae bacterium]